jgi:6-phosphogluconolactonase
VSEEADAPEVRIVDDAPALFRAAADEFVRQAGAAVETSGIFTVALAGGSTPQGLYELLARDRGYRDAVPWDRTHIFWGDDRHVPPDHKDSNYRMARESLLSRVGLPDTNVHRIETERPDASEAARDYEKTLRSFFRLPPGALPRFDLTLLGMGADGHTASLFPGSDALRESLRLVAAPYVSSLGVHRVTLTPAVLNNSACVVFLVSGAGKAAALRAVLDSNTDPAAKPARCIRPTRGRLVWLVDRAAAGDLRPPREPAGEDPAGAARIPGGIPQGASGVDRVFYAIADRYLDDMFRAYPTLATMAGYHRHDDRLEDLTPEGLREKTEMALRYRAELGGIDPARLSLSARIDYDLVVNDLDSAVFTLEELRPFERDPQSYVDLIGNATLFLTLQDEDSSVWPERLSALLSRMKGIPALLEAAKRNLRNPPRVITELVLGTSAGNTAFFQTTAPALFAKAPALESALRAENATVLKALREFQRWLVADLLPRSGGDWRLGKDLWTRKLRYTLQSDMSPEEILERARMKIEVHRRRMLEIATPLHDRMFPGHAHAETGDDRTNAIVKEVLAEVSRRHSTRATLFGDTKAIIERLKAYIRGKNLVTLPPDDDNFIVEPTPGFMDGIAVAFFNPPPILEPGLKKSFWISSVPRGGSPEKDREMEESFFREYNNCALQGLTIHEAFPGHYVQYWHALRSPIATIYKKIFSSGTFAEGWAVLAEKQMFESGYAEEETANLLVHLKQNLRSPMNAILDARMHTTATPEAEVDRWALEMMQRLGFQEEAEAKGKLRRAKVTSTQLSTYFVGFLELSDILEEARRREGASFDLKTFNERMLSFGTIPPRHVRELLRERPPGAGTPGPTREK